MKEVIWMGNSLKNLRKFPEDVKDEIGFALQKTQRGNTPDCGKPLKGLDGVMEIVTNDSAGTYRTVYTAKLGNKVYVLHAFQKKSKKGIAQVHSTPWVIWIEKKGRV